MFAKRTLLNETVMMLAVIIRYNSDEDFSKPKRSIVYVSKRLNIAESTIRSLLRRFVSNGNQIVIRKRGRP